MNTQAKTFLMTLLLIFAWAMGLLVTLAVTYSILTIIVVLWPLWLFMAVFTALYLAFKR